MTAKDFKRAVELAFERSEARIPLSDLNVFDGFGLKGFGPVHVKLEQVADLIRYQCFYIFRKEGDDPLDREALEAIRSVGRTKFTIIRPDLQAAVDYVLGPGAVRALEIFGDVR